MANSRALVSTLGCLFEVVVPGKLHKVTCRYTEAQFPNLSEQASRYTASGRGRRRSVRIRGSMFRRRRTRPRARAVVTRTFVEGAEQTVWQRGRRARQAEQKPFVAERARLEEADEEEQSEPAAADAGAGATADGDRALKRIAGQPFGLRSEYKEWSNTRLVDDDKLRQHPGPLELRLTQGSDAHSERNATVSLSLKNRSPDKQTVFFRREHVSFEVVGPDGIVTCDPQPDARAPDIQAFSTRPQETARSRPRAHDRACPQDTSAGPPVSRPRRFDPLIPENSSIWTALPGVCRCLPPRCAFARAKPRSVQQRCARCRSPRASRRAPSSAAPSA